MLDIELEAWPLFLCIDFFFAQIVTDTITYLKIDRNRRYNGAL